MKRKIWISILACILLSFAALSVKPLILFIAKKQLNKVFVDSAVKIGACSLKPLKQISLLDIEITKEPLYAFKAGRIDLIFTPFSILKGRIIKVALHEATGNINFGNTGINLENISLEVVPALSAGTLNIVKVKYGKAVISQIKTKARFDGGILVIDSLSAKFSNGEIRGNFSFTLDKKGECLADLEFINLDMHTFVKDFELEDKLKLSGKLTGGLKFKSRGQEITAIEGNLMVNQPGGMLTIGDTRYLESMARNSGESMDTLAESFKNYHYTSGGLQLSLDKGNLVFNSNLEGESGKRNLSVVLHDFNLGRNR